MLAHCFQFLLKLLVLCLLLPLSLNAQVTLGWDANSEPDLAGYKLYRGYECGVYDTIVDVGLITQYEVIGLALDQQYCFAVTAYDNEDPVNESDFSNTVTWILESDPQPIAPITDVKITVEEIEQTEVTVHAPSENQIYYHGDILVCSASAIDSEGAVLGNTSFNWFVNGDALFMGQKEGSLIIDSNQPLGNYEIRLEVTDSHSMQTIITINTELK